MDQKANNAGAGADPHERKHIGADAGADIQIRLARRDVPENHSHDRPDDRSGSSKESGDERPDREGERPPSAVQRYGCDEAVHEVHAHACQEEAEHDVAGNPDQRQDIIDLAG